MLKIKKYSNGRFFDTEKKEYIKSETLAEMVRNGEEIEVILTRTGKNITDQVIEQLSKKEERKNEKKKKESPFQATDKLMKWVGEVIDSKIEKVMAVIKLPTREQVANLEGTVKELNDKIDALTLAQEKIAKEAAASPKDKKKLVAGKAVDTKKAEAKKSAGDKKTVKKKPTTEKNNGAKTKPGDKKQLGKQPVNDKKVKTKAI